MQLNIRQFLSDISNRAKLMNEKIFLLRFSFSRFLAKNRKVMVFSFLQRNGLNKLLINPVIMYFLIREERNTNIKKSYTLCLPLIKKCRQIANFSS